MSLFPKDPDHPDRTVTEEEIEDALSHIRYTYADGEDGNLAGLNRDICDLVDNLESLGLVTNSMSDLGFAYAEQFANAFVDGSYMESAAGKT